MNVCFNALVTCFVLCDMPYLVPRVAQRDIPVEQKNTSCVSSDIKLYSYKYKRRVAGIKTCNKYNTENSNNLRIPKSSMK